MPAALTSWCATTTCGPTDENDDEAAIQGPGPCRIRPHPADLSVDHDGDRRLRAGRLRLQHPVNAAREGARVAIVDQTVTGGIPAGAQRAADQATALGLDRAPTSSVRMRAGWDGLPEPLPGLHGRRHRAEQIHGDHADHRQHHRPDQPRIVDSLDDRVHQTMNHEDPQMTLFPSPRRHGERGQMFVVMILAIVALLAAAALVIDGGNAFAQQRRTQNGLDAMAEAGATQLARKMSGVTISDGEVLAAINATKNANEITTLDSAEYTDHDGNALGTVGGGVIPPTAQGVHAVGSRDFDTYLAGVVGINQWTSAQRRPPSRAMPKRPDSAG